MNYQNKGNLRYLKANLSPKQFRLVRISPYILALLVLGNFIYKNLQYEANKPILEKYDNSQDIIYYYDKETNELFTGKASWILKFNKQRFEGSYKDGQLHGVSKIWHEMETLQKKLSMKKEYLFLKPHGMRTE